MQDSSKRPERLAWIAFALALVFLIFTAFLGFTSFLSRLMQATILPLAVTLIYSFVAWWRAFLLRREAEERNEEQRVRDEYDREDLFQDREEALRLARRAREGLDRYFVPSFTVVAGLLLILLGGYIWYQWNLRPGLAVPTAALEAAGLSAFFVAFCSFTGSYFNGVSRERGCRWLRPVGQWFLLSGTIYLMIAALMLLEHYRGENVWDGRGARVILGLMILFGIELLINFIIEFYRPRHSGEEPHPLFESRILALVTEPGGIAKNVAHALDYQFGFRVSETWFYGFVEKAVVPCVVLLLVVLYLLDCVVLIESGEKGLHERFGKLVSSQPLEPGLHLKWPWPMDGIRKFPVAQVQVVDVGFEEYAQGEKPESEPGKEEAADDTGGRVVVWNKKHFKNETPYLVASARQTDATLHSGPLHSGPRLQATGAAAKQTVPVNLLQIAVPVYYRIDETALPDYAYNYQAPAVVLRNLGSRVLTRLLASVDFIEAIGKGHYEVRQRIQAEIERELAAQPRQLGIKIVFVGLLGAHPPTEVGSSYQAVVAAQEKKVRQILEAEQYAMSRHSETRGESRRLVIQAQSYKYQKTTVASSEAQRFTEQLKAYRVAPEVYRTRLYLEMLEEVSPTIRKYLVAANDARQVLQVDLQEKQKLDIADLDLNAAEQRK